MYILYEYSFIVRNLPKAKTLAVAKRSLDAIASKGGYVHKVESLGLRDLPQRIKDNTKGTYFIVKFVAPTREMHSLKESFRLDQELLRQYIFPLKKPKEFECTLQDELKDPVYRPEVQKMIKEAEDRAPLSIRRPKGKFVGDYYPFSG